jgi:hypothetical protein
LTVFGWFATLNKRGEGSEAKAERPERSEPRQYNSLEATITLNLVKKKQCFSRISEIAELIQEI